MPSSSSPFALSGRVAIIERLARDAGEERAVARAVDIERDRVAAGGGKRSRRPERQVGVDKTSQDLVFKADPLERFGDVNAQDVLASRARDEIRLVAHSERRPYELARSRQVPKIQQVVVHP